MDARPNLPAQPPEIGDPGHVVGHGVILDALEALYSEHITGSVDPEGVVVATVGTTYSNTTTGTVWSKQSGTTATGWSEIGAGVATHAGLTGSELGDDHPQYLNVIRGDARYSKRVYVGPATDNPPPSLYDFWVVNG